MECEEVYVSPVVTMRNGELGRGTNFGPPNNPSADDNGSGGIVRRASRFALAARL